MRFFTKLCFPFRHLFPLSSHCSRIHPAFTNHFFHFLHYSTCVPLHCVLFLLCCWCYLFWAIGRLHSLRPGSFFLFASPRFLSCSPHVTTTICRSSKPALSFAVVCIPIVPPRPPPPRREGLRIPSPLNIYISHSPSSFHCCKIYTASCRSYTHAS
jgi:hypothetical protein